MFPVYTEVAARRLYASHVKILIQYTTALSPHYFSTAQVHSSKYNRNCTHRQSPKNSTALHKCAPVLAEEGLNEYCLHSASE
ncbi:hypothetical protein M758_2G053400, partial [Ceratodon purpureus]